MHTSKIVSPLPSSIKFLIFVKINSYSSSDGLTRAVDLQGYHCNQGARSGSVGSATFWHPSSGSAKICGPMEPDPQKNADP